MSSSLAAWALLLKPAKRKDQMRQANSERSARLKAVLRRRQQRRGVGPRGGAVNGARPGVVRGAQSRTIPTALILLALFASALVAACHPEPQSPPRSPPSLPTPTPGPSKPTTPPGPRSEAAITGTAVAANAADSRAPVRDRGGLVRDPGSSELSA